MAEAKKKAKSKDKLKDKKAAHKGEAASIIAKARAAAFSKEAPQAAFKHFRSLAEAVPTAELPIFNGQPLLMRANVLAALDIIEPHLEKAVKALHEPRLTEIFELPSL